MADMLKNRTSDGPGPARGLWALGFRPLYLGAGAFAVLAIGVWVGRFSGLLPGGLYLRDPLWHAHEMIFGYTVAVVVGFLLTAVRNWTMQPTPAGAPLAGIVALWLAARALLVAGLPGASLAADVAFAVAAAWGIGRPIRAAGNRRNAFFVVVLLAIGGANGLFYAAVGGHAGLSPQRMLTVALDLILFVMAVMGGRVIPLFTANALPTARPRRFIGLERAALASVLALLAADLLALPAAVTGALAAVAAVAHGARLTFWDSWSTRHRPILWILHLSYAWIVIHLLLRAWAAVNPAVTGLATHALTVGAIGGLTLGMMTRTARGHTGRPLTTGAAEVVAYVLVQLAAVGRVFVPLLAPGMALPAIGWSGALWAAAFAIFVGVYAPILWRPRIDGQPG